MTLKEQTHSHSLRPNKWPKRTHKLIVTCHANQRFNNERVDWLAVNYLIGASVCSPINANLSPDDFFSFQRLAIESRVVVLCQDKDDNDAR